VGSTSHNTVICKRNHMVVNQALGRERRSYPKLCPHMRHIVPLEKLSDLLEMNKARYSGLMAGIKQSNRISVMVLKSKSRCHQPACRTLPSVQNGSGLNTVKPRSYDSVGRRFSFRYCTIIGKDEITR
jgi:hypothetical protein